MRNKSLFLAAIAVMAITASATGQSRPAADVMPIKLSEKRALAPIHTARKRVYLALQKQGCYLLTTVHPWKEDAKLRLLTASESDENHIRPNTSAIEGFATLYRFGPYDESVVGVTRAALLQETIVPMMRYIVATHATGPRKTSDGKQWGNSWQSAYWAQMLGRAAWFLWDELPDDLQVGSRRVVAHEADRFVEAQPPHQIKLDTKAEENGWNSEIFSVALLLLPTDGRREAWEKALQRWGLSSLLRPSDAKVHALVDGRPVSEQFTGANLYDDFTLENHGFVHPDYMSTFGLLLQSSLDYRLSDRRPPEALMWNVPGVYENLKWFVLPDGGYVYPSGQDWRLFRNPDWVFPHVLMAVFGHDPDAWSLALRSLDTLEKAQARHASGAIYADEEYFFASTQQSVFRSLGLAWLALGVTDSIPIHPQSRMGVRRLDSGKLILNRTPTAIHTFSWGTRIMAQCVPMRLDRLVSPDVRSGIGHIRVKGADRSLPVMIHQVDVDHTRSGFSARLVLDHGHEQIRAYLEFVSSRDGTWVIREKLVALKEVTTTEVATGLIGILNDRNGVFQQGRRSLVIDATETVIPSCSGQIVDVPDARQVLVDRVLDISTKQPHHIRYAAATEPERARVTDRLWLNYQSGQQTWNAGDVISELEVVIRCRD